MPTTRLNGVHLYWEQNEGSDELKEPPETGLSLDLARLAAFAGPMLLTQEDQSAPFFPTIVDTIAASVPRARRHTFRGAGHVPHLTAADEYVKAVGGFLASLEQA